MQAWVDPAEEKAARVVQRSEHEHSRPFILSKFIVKPSELVSGPAAMLSPYLPRRLAGLQ
jgi:hypothetical protein